MDDDPQPLMPQTGADAAQRSLVDDVKLLLEDGRTLVEAELVYQKSRAAAAGSGVKGIAGWTLLALALAFFALMSLVLGLLIGLAQVIGIWLATLTAVLALLGCAAMCGLAVSRRWRRMSALLRDPDQPA